MTRRSRCTGVAAQWCPVHGSCRCTRVTPLDEDGQPLPGSTVQLDDPDCPLHAPISTHAEAPQ